MHVATASAQPAPWTHHREGVLHVAAEAMVKHVPCCVPQRVQLRGLKQLLPAPHCLHTAETILQQHSAAARDIISPRLASGAHGRAINVHQHCCGFQATPHPCNACQLLNAGPRHPEDSPCGLHLEMSAHGLMPHTALLLSSCCCGLAPTAAPAVPNPWTAHVTVIATFNFNACQAIAGCETTTAGLAQLVQ
jgi:hypothetical protein